MNSDDPADERIREALRSLPAPPSADVGRRVWGIVRRRRARRTALTAVPVVTLALALVVWRPWVGPPAPVSGPEIPPEDLAVLFAPPPVDRLNVLAARDDVWVAALGRLEGVK
jgi:hypothetical protein